MKRPRLMVLACDGADPALIMSSLDRFPSIASLCRDGSYGCVESITHSCDIWTTYYTGLPPEQHGVRFSRLALAKEPADLRRVQTDCFLWDWANRYGISTGFVEPLHAYPAPEVDGFFVSGVPRPRLGESTRIVHPKEMAGMVTREYTDGIPGPPSLMDLGVPTAFADLTDAELANLLEAGYFRGFPDQIRPNLEWYADLVMRLYERCPVDLLWVYFLEADIAGHFGFHESPPDMILRTYTELDRAFGRLVDRLNPDAVAFISDHGMLPIDRLLTDPKPVGPMQNLAEEYRLAGTRQVKPGLAVVQGYNQGLCTGTHNYQAFYALRGPGVYENQRVDIHFFDVFRMLVRALGLPVPNGRAGKTPAIFNEFSGTRAAAYDRLGWASHGGYMDAFVRFANLQPEHDVLDAGIGTGQVSARVQPMVSTVVGLDSSPDMLQVAAAKLPGLPLIRGDLRNIPLPDDHFDRVLVRSVLHHITSGLDRSLAELHRVLKPGGRVVIGEGIPPSPASVAHFTEVFRLKEERLVLQPQHLVQMLEATGFIEVRFTTYVMPQMSVLNWLEQTDLPAALRAQLLELHRTTEPAVQRDYRTKLCEGDVLVDFTFALISGRKIPAGA